MLTFYAGVLECWSSEKYSGPLTVVQLFTLSTAAAPATAASCYSGPTLEGSDVSRHFPWHLLVCSSQQTADVYRSATYFIQMSYTCVHFRIGG